MGNVGDVLRFAPPAKLVKKALDLTSTLLKFVNLVTEGLPTKLVNSEYQLDRVTPFYRDDECRFVEEFIGDFQPADTLLNNVSSFYLKKGLTGVSGKLNDRYLESAISRMQGIAKTPAQNAALSLIISKSIGGLVKHQRKVFEKRRDESEVIIGGLLVDAGIRTSYRPNPLLLSKAAPNMITHRPLEQIEVTNQLNGRAIFDRTTWRIIPESPGQVKIPIDVVDHLYKKDHWQPKIDFELDFKVHNRPPLVVDVPNVIYLDPDTYSAEVPIQVEEGEGDALTFKLTEPATNFSIDLDLEGPEQRMLVTATDIDPVIAENIVIRVPRNTKGSFPILLPARSITGRGEDFSVQFMDDVMVKEEGIYGEGEYPFTVDADSAETIVTLKIDEDADQELSFGIEEEPSLGSVRLIEDFGEYGVVEYTPSSDFRNNTEDVFTFWASAPSFPEARTIASVTIKPAFDITAPWITMDTEFERDSQASHRKMKKGLEDIL